MIRRRIRAGWGVALLAATLVVPIGVATSTAPAGAAPPPAIDPGAAGARPVEELSYDLGDEAFAPLRGFDPSGSQVRVEPKDYAATRVDLAALRGELPRAGGSAVVEVPSLIRTSIRKRGGKQFNNRTLTPSPITVVSEQPVVVGVSSTVTVLILDRADVGPAIEISSSVTTPSEPSEIGCSGSVMVEMRS